MRNNISNTLYFKMYWDIFKTFLKLFRQTEMDKQINVIKSVDISKYFNAFSIKTQESNF